MKRLHLAIAQLTVLAALVASASPARAQGDLALTTFYAEVSGTTVTYYATVCNITNTDITGNFSLGFFYHSATAPGCTSTPDQTVVISGLAGAAARFAALLAAVRPQAATPAGRWRTPPA